MYWQEISGGWVLIPPQPRGIIHFLGGAFVAAAPHVTYRCLLEQVGQAGYAVIATSFVNTLDHGAIARNVLNRFEIILTRLHTKNAFSQSYLPIYGIGHSLGCKLHLLISSLFSVQRAGNILISYNNYPVNRAIPLAEQFNLTSGLNWEFSPSPEETNKIITKKYQVRRNLLVKFTDDTIDQTLILNPILQNLFPHLVTLQTLSGNHLTPLGQEITWQSGKQFSPLDAFGQWIKQEVYRDLEQLNQEILRWLNPI